MRVCIRNETLYSLHTDYVKFRLHNTFFISKKDTLLSANILQIQNIQITSIRCIMCKLVIITKCFVIKKYKYT